MLVREHRAVKLTLFLLLAESVLCQEKWSRDLGEVHKSETRKSVEGKGFEGLRNGVENRDPKNDGRCEGSDGDNASISRPSEKLNKVKLTDKDKTGEKSNTRDEVIGNEKRNINPTLSITPEPFISTNRPAKPSLRNDNGPTEISTAIYEDLHSSKRNLTCSVDATFEKDKEDFEKESQTVIKKELGKQQYKEDNAIEDMPVQVRQDTTNDQRNLKRQIETTVAEATTNADTTLQDKNITLNEDDINALWDDYVLDLEDNSILEDVDHRIIGGQLISISDVPYLTTILRLHREICGGTLITLSHVLTAAHCITVKGRQNIKYIVLRPDGYSIRYGSNSSQQGGHIVPAGRFYVHPDYLSRTDVHVYMDLAIIWFASNIDESMASIVKLPTIQPNYERVDEMASEGEECVVAGWGMTKKPSRLKRSLLVGTKLKLIKYEQCNDTFAKHGYGISKIAHICTYSENTDACHGDSGGGLYCKERIWGVTSWGIGCAEKEIPGVFARVDTNLDFIKSVIYSEPDIGRRAELNSLSSIQFDGYSVTVTCLLLYLIISSFLT